MATCSTLTTDIVEGQTPIQGIINSPLFQNYNFNQNAAIYIGGSSAGLVKVGNTQVRRRISTR